MRPCSLNGADRARFVLYGLTPATWAEICARFDNRCASCRQEKKLTVDHVFPQVKGGTHDPSNLQPLCRHCNSRKMTRHVDFSIPGAEMPPRARQPNPNPIRRVNRVPVQTGRFRSKFDDLVREKAYREKRSLPIRVIAQETGLSTTTIQRVKAGKMDKLYLSTLERLCFYFDVNEVSDLIKFEKTPPA